MKNINILKILMLIFISIAIFCASFFVGYINSKSYATNTEEQNTEISETIENVKTEKLPDTQKENKQILNNEKLIENINIEEIKQETLFDIFKFGDDIPEWMIEDKNITLQEYTYYPPVITINSDENFYKNKVGKNGVGQRASEYLEQYNPPHVLSKNQVDKLFAGEELKNE